MKKYDIVAMGELLIDFTEYGIGKNGMKLFEQNPGGAPANLLAATARLGAKTAFIGKVGKDMHGEFLKTVLEKENINTDGFIEDEKYFTTLAFVEIDENGERKFSFSRKPGADTMISSTELDREVIANGKIFHFGSLSLTDEPAKSAVLEAVNFAKKNGAIISYDPNYRALLWPDVETAVREMSSVLSLVDMIKISDEESLLLTGKDDPVEAAKEILKMGPKIAAITLGAKGALVARMNNHQSEGKKTCCESSDSLGMEEAFTKYVEGFKVQAVDTTGAGDSFWGGFLHYFLETGKNCNQLTGDDLIKCAEYGNAVAALNVQKRGGIPAMPYKKDVEEILK